jgi:hypothetical protein
MSSITRASLLQLIDTPGDRFVSIYMPTYPAGRETPQNPTRFKELLATASDLLRAKGMDPSDTRDFLAPGTRLLDQPTFWNALDRELAVLISQSGMRVWLLRSVCEELCVVGRRFHVTPLVAWSNQDAPYYVLAVSQNHVKFFQGSRHALQEIEVPKLPANSIEALHYDPREGFYQTHSGQPALKGKEGVVFTGQGGKPDVAKQEIAEFFGIIDAAVSSYLHARTEPLVFAGVDYLYPIYRRRNHYPHLLSEHVDGNPDLLSPMELRENVWPLIETVLRERQELEIEKYWNLVRQGRCSNRADEIVLAAHAGIVETLFVCPTVRRIGSFDPQAMAVRLDDHTGHNCEDLVNFAVCLTLKHRGNVEVIQSGNIPGGGAMAAITRYPLSDAIPPQPVAQGEKL